MRALLLLSSSSSFPSPSTDRPAPPNRLATSVTYFPIPESSYPLIRMPSNDPPRPPCPPPHPPLLVDVPTSSTSMTPSSSLPFERASSRGLPAPAPAPPPRFVFCPGSDERAATKAFCCLPFVLTPLAPYGLVARLVFCPRLGGRFPFEIKEFGSSYWLIETT